MAPVRPGSESVESLTSEQTRVEVCNQQLTDAMRELRNAIQKVEDIREFTVIELDILGADEIIDNPVLARANELLFESSIMLQAFTEE